MFGSWREQPRATFIILLTRYKKGTRTSSPSSPWEFNLKKVCNLKSKECCIKTGAVFWTKFNLWKQIMKLQGNRTGLFFFPEQVKSSISRFPMGVYLHPQSLRLGKCTEKHIFINYSNQMCAKYESRDLKMFPKVCFMSTDSLRLLFTMMDLNHSVRIGSGGDASAVSICPGRRTRCGGWSFRGATENCAVMVENAERLIRVHFAAIISLSLSSNKHWRKKRERERNLRSECDIMLTIQCVGTVQTDTAISAGTITAYSRLA